MSQREFRFAPLHPGDPVRVGRYTLRALLGRGGTCRVFLSFTPGGQPLAIKVLEPAVGCDPQSTARFADEVRVAQRVDGGHVARLVDADPDAPRPWLASAYVSGPSLRELVTAAGPLPVADTLLVALGMARALTSIHLAGAVHRDLKPANVILDEAGPKVIDFGIAKPLTSPSNTDAGVLRIGTLPYMSPEQALGRHVTASSDVFSLGSTIYFLATGRSAFEAGHELATVDRIVREEPELSGLDHRLRTLVRACLIKDPLRRPTPVQAADLCLDALGPIPPGAYLNIAQAAVAIRERTEALRELSPAPPRAQPHAGRRRRREGTVRTQQFTPSVLPAAMPSLAGGVPPAPPGTIYVKSAQGGFCVPPRRFTLHFGRASEEVHVPVGPDDPYVSRQHGVLSGDDGRWRLRNDGQRPIQLPGGDLVLRGHDVPMASGYTPLAIQTPNCRSHLIEVFVVGYSGAGRTSESEEPTAVSNMPALSPGEQLVVTALAQRYLRQEPYPQPVSWKQVARDLNCCAPRPRQWTAKIAENMTAAIRRRLAAGARPVPGLLQVDGIGEPVGCMLSHNLIVALLKDGALTPGDLSLIEDEF